MPYCTACGAEVGASDSFCRECGQRRGDPGTEQETNATTASADGDALFERGSLSFSFAYPTSDGYEPFLLGAVVSLLGTLLPPLKLFAYGYGFRLTATAARGETPPSFDDFGRLFVDGLRVVLALALVAGATLAVGVAVADLTVALGLSRGLSNLALVVVAGAGLYVTPAVLTTYAATGRVTRAFTGRDAGAFAGSPRYVRAFAGWAAFAFAAATLWVAALLTLLASPFVSTYAAYASAAFWGYQYRAAAADGVVPATAADPASSVADAGSRRSVPEVAEAGEHR
ncbi:DUF4013 domain-containing protein [Haloarcula litorea]|uniref:DUF4013 domain-containing protein n=1 Tax=Haloarcula litorea TaxID=3032579 RepID=UPI0023E8B6BD|nr:DUF4013 domain-containing protein [Halomicroarcula sp. GDY20]